MSPKIKFHQKKMFTKTRISSKLKCHQNRNFTKTEMLPNIIIMSSKSKSKSKRSALITLVLLTMKLSRCTLANTLLRFPRYIESVKVCLYHFIGESNPNICLPEFKKELHAAGECSISLALCSWRALHQFSFLWPGQKPQGWRIETVPLGCMKEDWNVSSANPEPPVHKKKDNFLFNSVSYNTLHSHKYVKPHQLCSALFDTNIFLRNKFPCASCVIH